MDDLQQLLAIVVKLNNRGAFEIETRQYGNAVSTLTEAIVSSKQVIARYRVESSSQEDAQLTHSTEECYFSLCMQSPYDEASPPPLMPYSESFWDQPITTDNDDEGGTVEFVYRHPIRIPRQAISHSLKFSTATSIMLIFNLALAHHLYAIEETFSRPMIDKSTRLYECAYSLLRQHNFEANVLFVLATVNNLGQAHKSLDQSEKATKCFQHLLSTLMFLVECDVGEKTPSFEGFFRSTSHLLFPKDCYAAAA
jgi:hypothetical protein